MLLSDKSLSVSPYGKIEIDNSNLIEEILIGILLGDAWLEKAKVNARLRFEQSHIRADFFFHVFNCFIILIHLN